MMISKALQRKFESALGAHLYAHHCRIKGRDFAYHALSLDVREAVPRVTMTRAVTLGLFALAAKKRTAQVMLHDWASGAVTTVTVHGADIAKVYELKSMLHVEQVYALNGARS